MMKQATLEEVFSALKDEDSVVVDARSSSAFIGWRLDGEEFEGHIKGSVDYSADWLNVLNKPVDYEEQLQSKLAWRCISSETNVIIYDYTGKDAPVVAEYFEKQGIKNLSYFPLKDWTGEMVYYPNYSTIVPVEWVNDLVNDKKPENYSGDDYKILHVSWGKPQQVFLDSHIPKAIHIDSEEFEVGPEWVRVSDEELEKFACKYGISINTTVVLYGYSMLGLGAAAKLAVVLKYMGVKQVCLMNGMFENYVSKGFSIEGTINEPIPCETFGGKIPFDKSYLVDIDEAKEILADKSLGQVIDIRNWEEYIGKYSGYDYVPKAGRIPNSIWCWNKNFYTNPDRTMSNAQEMLDFWEKCGIDTSKKMAFFCGSASWGAAIIEFYGRSAGINNATIYEGGWCQWQLDPCNKYETGTP